MEMRSGTSLPLEKSSSVGPRRLWRADLHFLAVNKNLISGKVLDGFNALTNLRTLDSASTRCIPWSLTSLSSH
jgi:hypothetical protein